jgi:hypothetical protein
VSGPISSAFRDLIFELSFRIAKQPEEHIHNSLRAPTGLGESAAPVPTHNTAEIALYRISTDPT